MGVIPGGSDPVPEGGQSAADMAALQLVTEQSVRAQVSGVALSPWNSAHGSFFSNIIGGIGTALQQGISGLVNTIGSWAGSFFDAGREVADVKNGQDDIRDRVDLLTGLYGYIFAYMSNNVNGEWGSDNTRTLPFDKQLGPAKNAHIDTAGRVVLDGAGAWLILVKAHARGTQYTGNASVKMVVTIRRPDGSQYHQTIDHNTTLIDAGLAGSITKGAATITSIFPVVIDTPGSTVSVQVWAGSWMWWDGGTRYSMLSAIRQSTDVVNVGDETVPDETRP